MNEIIKKNGITFGVLSGIVSILVTTLIYTININLFTSWWIGILNILIYLTISIVLLLKTKKQLKGIFSFKDAFTTYFISAVVGILIAVIFNIILFNYFDPSIKETIKELSIKMVKGMMEKFNAPPASINEAIKNLQDNDQFSIGQLLKGMVFNILFSSVFGLILAAFFKSRPAYNQ